MSILDSMNTGGVVFPIEEADGEEDRRGGKKRRMFLMGGPWGTMYPMGMFPIDDGGEEEDPNP